MTKPTRPSQPPSNTSQTTRPHAQGERRGSGRVAASTLPPFKAELVDGATIEVVNVSKTGVLTQSSVRLLPGAMIGLRVVTEANTFVVFGRVVRSRLLSVTDGQSRYESAIALARDFPLIADASRIVFESRPAPDATGTFPVEIGRTNGIASVVTVSGFGADDPDEVIKALDAQSR